MTTTLTRPSAVSTPLPDTLNLAARAHLAINALDALRDEKLGGQIYFYIKLFEEPPTAYHAPWDYGDGTGRHIDALTFMHIMTGSPRALAVAYELADLLAQWQGDKGLSWWPLEPWTVPGRHSTGLWQFAPDVKPHEQVADVTWSQRGALLGLTTLFQLTGEDRFRQHALQIVTGMDAVALRKDNYRYLPEMMYRRDGWHHTAEPLADGTSELKHAPSMFPLLRFFLATGHEPALRLAEGFLRFVLHRAEGYEPDGSFHKTIGYWNHFHSKSAVITAAIRLGIITRQPEFIAWGRQAYDAARRWGTDFGWFPEDLCIFQCCETCCTTDMIESAILLGLHVDPKYFTDVERYARNHLVESQFMDTAYMNRIPRIPAEQNPVTIPPQRICTHNIPQRCVGSFAGFSAPNDLFGEPSDPKWKNVRIKIMQCCTGAGARALYDVWHYTADDDGQKARVHMAFSRPTPWADIISHAPYAGRIDLRMKAPRSVGIRIPAWAAPSSVCVQLNGHDIPAPVKASYVNLENLKPGDLASVQFDQPLTSHTYHLGPDTYVANFKGDTVLSITPQGRYAPLYQRDHFLANDAPQTNPHWYLPPKEIAPL